MDEIPITLGGGDESAQIDHCTRCGGLFIEFFDGDPVDLTLCAVERLRQPGAEPVTFESATCPDCQTSMHHARYYSSTFFRCETCMAVFATQKQQHDLVDHVRERHNDKPPSMLDRLVSVLNLDPPQS